MDQRMIAPQTKIAYQIAVREMVGIRFIISL